MNRTVLVLIVAISNGLLCAQNVVYQQAGAIGVTSGGPVAVSTLGAVQLSDPIGAHSVSGSPFSGTEERHSLQVLGDGTRIERIDSTRISRDGEGRTRFEMPPGPDGHSMVMIQDPVAGVHYVLDTVQKTASKIPLPPKGAGIFSMSSGSASSGAVKAVGIGAASQAVISDGPMMAPAMKADEESLGAQTVNGVLAKGTRSTINIPVGQIGNDRAIQVVSERWYSDDLQMVVKSSNSDPRFGTTTYELTDINRAEPDPGLFRVPADYTVREGDGTFTTSPVK